MTTSILFVCLGNICRSPAAEAIFLKEIENQSLLNKFAVDSAGTGGWHVGNPADSRMREAAFKRGIDIRSKARKLNLQDFQIYDFILTMDNSNLKDVQEMAQDIGANNIAKIAPILSYSSQKDFIEVPDPYYGGDSGFDVVLDLLEDAIKGLLNQFNY